MSKILLIEDQKEIAEFIEKGLVEEGYLIDVLQDGEEGLYRAEQFSYDLLILDLQLPKLDGIELLKRLRSKGKNLPVLILSARSQIQDKIIGLDIGADDYMTKPFHFEEFLSRVRALLRRKGTSHEQDLMVISDLEINLRNQQVKRKNNVIPLTSKEYQLLVLLARNQGQVLSRAMILERIWDMNYDGDTNIVDVFIRYLRKKIDLDPASALIHTIRGAGYMLDLK